MSAGRGKKLPSPDDTLRIALSLARAGWPVFPVTIYKGDDGKRHKVPAVPRGTSWVDWATTDPEKIATAWGGEQAGCWVGVHAGAAGLVILDVDREPDDGKANLKKAGLVPPPTFSYKTLGGGRHYLYAAPEGRTLTNAQGLVYDGARIAGVDVRGGNGYIVYYGPELEWEHDRSRTPDDLADAPDWVLIDATAKAADAAPSADEAAYRARLIEGKPTKAVRKVLARVKPTGMSHDDMLEAITELVKLGTAGAPGVAVALDVARDTYSRDWPDAARHWDNALVGSIKRIGLPPVTLDLPKAERKAIAERNSPAAIEEANAARKAEWVVARIDVGEGQLTDASIAEVLLPAIRADWANVAGVGLLRYDGIVWAEADELLLIEHVRRIMRKIRSDVTKAAIMRGDAKTEQDAKLLEGRSKVVAVARFIAGMLLDEAPELDADPDVLNVLNGVVDLRTGELRERRRDDYFTKVAAAEYHPGARLDDWEKALKALPKSTRSWLKVRLGQAATGRISVDKSIPFCIGGGDNGKSAILGATRHALGSYAVTVPERLLLGSDNDHPTEIMTLEGTRLAIFEELPRGGRLNAQRLKLLAGTNVLSGRRMRMDFHSFRATHTLIGATNHLPVITDVDDAMWNRVAPVPFPYKFVEPYRPPSMGDPGALGPKPGTNQREGDMGLRDRLAEAEGELAAAVLAWIVEGAVESYRGIPSKPKHIVAAHEEWRGEADPVLGFIRDRLELDEHSAIAATDLYHEFGAYLEARGQTRWSDQLIASSFMGHSSLDGVVKRQVKFGGGMMPSRPPFTIKPIPPRAMAWVGVRFRSEAPAAPMSPEVADMEARMRS
jgi:putative DNA primase/helicase